MLKYIKIFIALLIFIFPIYDLFGAGYVCDDVMKYTSCNQGYYMAQSKTDPTCNPTPQAGNACLQCPEGHTCVGGTNCPAANGVFIFDLNGGEGTIVNQPIKTGENELPNGKTTSYYRNGHILQGWSKAKDGTGGIFWTITYEEIPTDNLTLYAIWDTCEAGTYKDGNISNNQCQECSTRSKYSNSGAASCTSVSKGYYTTGCDNDGNKCTGQKQCNGSVYCEKGEQKNCPTATSGWKLGTGQGWSSVTECNQTKDATTVSEYCKSGQLKQTASSATAWNASSVSASGFEAKPGAYVTGTDGYTTCTQCEEGYWCEGGTYNPTKCPDGEGSPAGSASEKACTDNCTGLENQTVCLGIPGCAYDPYKDSTKCYDCPAGSYCEGDQKGAKLCPETHPNSEEGSEKNTQCYAECDPIEITGGLLNPDEKNVVHPNACQYNNWDNADYVTCNNQNDKCKGYHFNNEISQDKLTKDNVCIPNAQDCRPASNTNASSGIKFWSSSDGDYGECYIYQCDEGYHGRPDPTFQQCPDNHNLSVYPACDPNTISCETNLGNCQNGSIVGEATWSDTAYDYTECSCNKDSEKAGDCGTRSSSCQYKEGTGNNTTWDNCTYGNISCQAGCCLETSDSIECYDAPLGYYGSNAPGKTVCTACPAGSTTIKTGEQTINACTITGGDTGTNFCDPNGCFNLPSGINIPY